MSLFVATCPILSGFAQGQTYADLAVTNELKLQMTVGAPHIMKLLSNGCFYSIAQRDANDTPILSLSSYTDVSTVFFWESGRTALRAGLFSGARLNPWNMGVASAAFGYDTEARSLALAGGSMSKAYGDGYLAYGQTNIASGPWSIALGDTSAALGGVSFAVGIVATATGAGSVALGAWTLAGGDFSLAGGIQTHADSYGSVTFGRHNVGSYTGTNGNHQWNAEDPLFELGNGADATAATNWSPIPSNALTVYKNGNATFQGVVRVAPGGDIPMFVP